MSTLIIIHSMAWRRDDSRTEASRYVSVHERQVVLPKEIEKGAKDPLGRPVVVLASFLFFPPSFS